MISKSSVCCRMIATHVKKIKKLLVWLVMLVGGVSGLLTSCVDNDDVPENYYSSTKLTAAEFLQEHSEDFSEFIGILKRMGYSDIDGIPTATCDTIARTHIIKKGAFFTTDIDEGALPELNMDDSYIVLSSDSDVANHNALVYYINKNARMVDYNDSVTNGVVHVLNNVITSSSLLSFGQCQTHVFLVAINVLHRSYRNIFFTYLPTFTT